MGAPTAYLVLFRHRLVVARREGNPGFVVTAGSFEETVSLTGEGTAILAAGRPRSWRQGPGVVVR